MVCFSSPVLNTRSPYGINVNRPCIRTAQLLTRGSCKPCLRPLGKIHSGASHPPLSTLIRVHLSVSTIGRRHASNGLSRRTAHITRSDRSDQVSHIWRRLPLLHHHWQIFTTMAPNLYGNDAVAESGAHFASRMQHAVLGVLRHKMSRLHCCRQGRHLCIGFWPASLQALSQQTTLGFPDREDYHRVASCTAIVLPRRTRRIC